MNKLTEAFTKDSSGGVYETYLNIKNPLIVEGNGASWKEIPFEGKLLKTRDISEIAKKEDMTALYSRMY